jgi:hypothetical protein
MDTVSLSTVSGHAGSPSNEQKGVGDNRESFALEQKGVGDNRESFALAFITDP